MTTEADNIRLWASLRRLREPLSQRLSELSDEDRRRTLAENQISGFLANPSTVSPSSNIEEDDDDYIGQEWIVGVEEVAGEIEAQGFRDEAEFLKQQCQREFGQPDFSASNELEAVRNLLAFIDSNEVTQSGEVPVNTKDGNTPQRPDDRPDGLKRPAFDVAWVESQLKPSRQAVGEWMARRQTIDELPGMAKVAYAVQRDDDDEREPPKPTDGKPTVKATPTSDASGATAEPGLFLTSELLKMTGLGSTALNSYIARTNVPKTKRGKRNRRFTISEAREILKAIVEHSSNQKDKQRAEEALKDLA